MSQESAYASIPAAAPGAKDGLFFLTILMNMKNKPEVDWNVVAQEAGFKNAKVASTRFGQMKKKFTSNNASAPSTPNASFTSNTTVANTPTSSPSKKVKREVGSGTNISSGRVKKSPVKGNGMARGPNAKARAILETENEDDKVVNIFVGGDGKWEDEEYMGEM